MNHQAPSVARGFFSRLLELKEEAGNTIATGTPLNDPRNRKLLIVPLAAPLTAGRYKVSWHAVSEDTHRVKGEYSFEVAR